MPPKNVRDASKEYKELEKRIEALAKAVEKGTKRVDDMGDSLKVTKKETKGASEWVRNFRHDIDKVNDKGEKGIPIWTKWGKRMSVLRSRMLIVSFAGRLVAKTIGQMFEAAAKQQQAEIKLESALGRTSKALLEQASALQGVTIFGDEVIIDAQAQIAAFIKDEDQIKKLTRATLDLASAKGMDLKTASDLVAKSVGSSTNALSRYGIAASGASKSSERIESVTKNIAILYGGQARKQADSYAGAISRLGNAFSDMQESIGELLAPLIMPLLEGLKLLFNVIEDVSDGLKSLKESTTSFVHGMRGLSESSTIAEERLGKYHKVLLDMSYEELIAEQKKYAVTTDKTTEANKSQEESMRKLFAPITAQNDNLKTGVQFNKENAGAVAELATAEEKRNLISAQLIIRETKAQEIYQKTAISQKESIKNLLDWAKANEKAFRPAENFRATIEMLQKQLDATGESSKANAITIGQSMSKISAAGIQMAKGNKDQTIFALHLAKAQAIANIYTGATQDIKGLGWKGFFQAMATIAGGLGMIANIDKQIASIKSSDKFAEGGDFVTTGPRMIMVGDNPGGREHVQVTPLSSPNISGPGSGGSINISISGNLLSQDYVENELADSIKDAIRRGTDFGIG